MSESIEHSVDRSGWPSGAWDSEPDREEWRSHGLPCLVTRNRLGSLCGYVGVPPKHPLHGSDYSDDATASLEVHGGLTYASRCAGHICHVAQPGEPEEVWWLGFDCGHAWDIQPGMVAALGFAGFPGSGCDLSDGTSYRSIGYVRAEVERLAAQLVEMTNV